MRMSIEPGLKARGFEFLPLFPHNMWILEIPYRQAE
jgi:hypothetical protein